jgi:hypothetical protein
MEMAGRNSLSHDPNLAQDATAVEPQWTAVGENVGVGYTVQQLHDAFMGSSGHRANIMKPTYNQVGVGVAMAGSTMWVTVRFLTGPPPPPPPPTAGIALVDDFTGDGRDDIFVYGPASAPDQFLISIPGGTFSPRTVSVTGTYRPVAGDFDGDGKAEIIWYGVGSAGDSMWEWTGSGWSSRGLSISGDYRPSAGDFDGDGNDDVLWYGLTTRADAYWWGTDTFGSFTPGSMSVTGLYRVDTGDLDGDGFDDVLLYGPGSGVDKILFGRADRHLIQITIDAGGNYRPAIGDVDGNGVEDIVWYGPGTASDAIWYLQTSRGSFTRVTRTVGGDHLPDVGDTNGDAAEDILWYNPSSSIGDALWRGVAGSTATTATSVRV